jgi:IS5 family transposase
MNFIHHSSLTRLRARLGPEGIAVIESEVFEILRRGGAVTVDSMLQDSTVLANNIVYPTDTGLIFKAFGKMRLFAALYSIPLWWDDKALKKLWRESNLNKNKGKIYENFLIFSELFSENLKIFREKVLIDPTTGNLRLLRLVNTPEDQNVLKIKGEKHIENRIVSLDEPDARPIKKGKKHPSCEFGTTLQLSFNRQGFMVTTENFTGKPDDSRLWSDTSDLFIKRMKGRPGHAVGDPGYRSRKNMGIPEKTDHIFLGRSTDAAEEERDYCRRARSATEGFIAVAKNLRGFGRSLYRGLSGDRIWSRLCQTSYNLKKLFQLYRNEELPETCLIRLGLLI